MATVATSSATCARAATPPARCTSAPPGGMPDFGARGRLLLQEERRGCPSRTSVRKGAGQPGRIRNARGHRGPERGRRDRRGPIELLTTTARPGGWTTPPGTRRCPTIVPSRRLERAPVRPVRDAGHRPRPAPDPARRRRAAHRGRDRRRARPADAGPSAGPRRAGSDPHRRPRPPRLPAGPGTPAPSSAGRGRQAPDGPSAAGDLPQAGVLGQPGVALLPADAAAPLLRLRRAGPAHARPAGCTCA